MKKKRKFSVSVLILVLVLILFTVPFYIMLTGSLKNNSALELKPPDFNIFKNVSHCIRIMNQVILIQCLVVLYLHFH